VTQCAENTECIGPFVSGEVPAPLQYQFLDASGVGLPIQGYEVRFLFAEEDLPSVEHACALVDGGANGVVQYVWQDGDLDVVGHYIGELWTGNGTQRYASVRVLWDVRRSRGPVPAI
jgi:hypothetical protein